MGARANPARPGADAPIYAGTMSAAIVALHLGALHPYEKAVTLLLAFGPFVVLAIVIAVRRRHDLAEERADAQSSDGQSSDGQGSDGQSSDGQGSDGQSSDIEPTLSERATPGRPDSPS